MKPTNPPPSWVDRIKGHPKLLLWGTVILVLLVVIFFTKSYLLPDKPKNLPRQPEAEISRIKEAVAGEASKQPSDKPKNLTAEAQAEIDRVRSNAEAKKAEKRPKKVRQNHRRRVTSSYELHPPTITPQTEDMGKIILRIEALEAQCGQTQKTPSTSEVKTEEVENPKSPKLTAEEKANEEAERFRKNWLKERQK